MLPVTAEAAVPEASKSRFSGVIDARHRAVEPTAARKLLGDEDAPRPVGVLDPALLVAQTPLLWA
jgi:hypothetical protein